MWPTAEEVDAQPGRWWWVDGEPSRLSVDRMEHPHRVVWRSRFVADLPVEMFGGPALAPTEVAALTAERDEACRLLLVMADACRKAHALNYGLDDGAFYVVDAVESAISDSIADWGDLDTALRRVCGVSNG